MYIPSRDVSEIAAKIVQMPRGDQDVVAILVGEKDCPDLEALIAELNRLNIVFLGGIFPGIIYDTQRYESGVVAMVLPSLSAPSVIPLGGDAIDLPDFDARVMAMPEKCTAMIFVDGLTSNISDFLGEMFHYFGDAIHYVGGGAGSLSLKQAPCVFTSEGVFQDAAVIAFLDVNSRMGVRHGWERLMGPLVATKTRHNVILELNWENAFDVYRRVLEPDAGMTLTQDNFFDVAKGYPFGIFKEGLEDVVRDPISVTSDGALVCVGDVPENTTLNILKGFAPTLIEAAGQATTDSLLDHHKTIGHCFVVDCISRVIFLQDEFDDELNLIAQRIREIDAQSVPCGILSLGEISSYGEGLLEFFNKTVVVGVLS